jgi:hypothetical protein
MTDLDARSESRFSGWTNVIAGVLIIVLYTAVSPPWSDPDGVSRLIETVLLILAVVMVVQGCRQLSRSKTT